MNSPANESTQPGNDTFQLKKAAMRIVESPAPVLFIDTCSLVDLVRMPNPNRTALNETDDCKRDLEAADSLLGRARDENLWVVVPPLVSDEYHEHAPRAATKVLKQWESIDDKVHISLFADGVLNIPASLPPQSNFSQNLEPLLVEVKSVADNLLRIGLHMEVDQNCRDKAFNRVVNKTPPGHKGGEMKDCVIIEHAIALCDLLSGRVATPRVFLTSNTHDFSVSRGSSEPEPPLDNQLDAVGLQLAIKWQQAQNLL